MSFAITMLGILGERPRNAKPFFRAGPGVRAGCAGRVRRAPCPYQLKRPLPLRLLA